MLARRPVWNHLAKEIPVATRGSQARIRFGTVSPETPRRGAEQRWGRSCKSPVGRLEASTSGLKGVDVVRANGTPWQPNHFQNRQTIAASTSSPLARGGLKRFLPVQNRPTRCRGSDRGGDALRQSR